jgi:hypothetical protein
MPVTHVERTEDKGVIEKYYIYKETANKNQLNDRLTVAPNVIFDTLLRSLDAHRDPH